MVHETRTRIPISAGWVLQRVQEGREVRLRNAIIVGDLDLNQLDLPTRHQERTESQKHIGLADNVKIVRSAISITKSSIRGKLDFRNAVFSEHAFFEGVTFERNATFLGATFCGASFEGATFSRQAWFDGATFDNDARFGGTTFGSEALFEGATFGGEAGFDRTNFRDYAHFGGATFGGGAWFERAAFSDDAEFRGATFSERTSFNRTTFSDGANFRGAFFGVATYFNGTTFGGNASFDGTAFRGYAEFGIAKFEGYFLTFRDATFHYADSQEEACRWAKNVLAKAGNRDEEEYHFYREMEAKRIQKGIRGNSGLGLGDCLKTETWSFWKFFLHDVVEFFFVQKIFGYGIHPYWLFGWWLSFVAIFAVVYSIKGAIEQPDAKQWYDYVWFSIATAATPGYALYKPVGLFRIIAGIEAILGTFMWAAFITTFARKFSR